MPGAGLVWPQLPRVAAEIKNVGDLPLRELNVEHRDNRPLLRVWAGTGDEPRALAQPEVEGGQAPLFTLEPGRSLGTNIDLAQLRAISGPGEYTIEVVYRWVGGGQASERRSFEIGAAMLGSLAWASFHGGPSTYGLCLWTEARNDRAWLSTLDLEGEPVFRASVRLPRVPAPSVGEVWQSSPPCALPSSQWIGWVEDGQLRWIRHAHGELEEGVMALAEPGWRLMAPLFEDPFVHGQAAACEVLLQRPARVAAGGVAAGGGAAAGVAGRGGSEIVALRLSDARPLGERVVIRGTIDHARSVYLADARRLTLIAGPDMSGLDGHTEFRLVPWRHRGAPEAAMLGATLPGELVDLDLVVTGSRGVVGVAVLAWEGRLWLHGFCIGVAGAPQWITQGEPRELGEAKVGVCARVGPDGRRWVLEWIPGSWILSCDGIRRRAVPIRGCLPALEMVFTRSGPRILAATRTGGLQAIALELSDLSEPD